MDCHGRTDGGFCYLRLFLDVGLTREQTSTFKVQLGSFPTAFEVLKVLLNNVQSTFDGEVRMPALVAPGFLHIPRRSAGYGLGAVIHALWLYKDHRVGSSDQLLKQMGLDQTSIKFRPSNLAVDEVVKSIVEKQVIEAEAVTRSATPLRINFDLTKSQQLALSDSYRNYQLLFERTNRCGHGMSAASRVIEINQLLNRCLYDRTRKPNESYDAQVIDFGGNWATHYQYGRRWIHSCCPSMDASDSARATSRFATVKKNGAITTEQYAMLQDMSRSSDPLCNSVFCARRCEECSVKAPTMIFVHSIYDATNQQIADAMEAHGCSEGFGTFIYSFAAITSQSGTIDGVDARFERQGDYIHFTFKGDTSIGYCHDFNTYAQFVSEPILTSSSGKKYLRELETHVLGVQYFSIRALSTPIYEKCRLFWQYVDNEYDDKMMEIITFVIERKRCVYGNVKLRERKIYAKKSFWDRLTQYGFRTEDSRFSIQHMLSYGISLSRDVVVGGTQLAAGRDIARDTDELVQICTAAYLYVYVERYNMGKVVQQYVSDEKAVRDAMQSGVVGNVRSVMSRFFEGFRGLPTIVNEMLLGNIMARAAHVKVDVKPTEISRITIVNRYSKPSSLSAQRTFEEVKLNMKSDPTTLFYEWTNKKDQSVDLSTASACSSPTVLVEYKSKGDGNCGYHTLSKCLGLDFDGKDFRRLLMGLFRTEETLSTVLRERLFDESGAVESWMCSDMIQFFADHYNVTICVHGADNSFCQKYGLDMLAGELRERKVQLHMRFSGDTKAGHYDALINPQEVGDNLTYFVGAVYSGLGRAPPEMPQAHCLRSFMYYSGGGILTNAAKTAASIAGRVIGLGITTQILSQTLLDTEVDIPASVLDAAPEKDAKLVDSAIETMTYLRENPSVIGENFRQQLADALDGFEGNTTVPAEEAERLRKAVEQPIEAEQVKLLVSEEEVKQQADKLVKEEIFGLHPKTLTMLSLEQRLIPNILVPETKPLKDETKAHGVHMITNVSLAVAKGLISEDEIEVIEGEIRQEILCGQFKYNNGKLLRDDRVLFDGDVPKFLNAIKASFLKVSNDDSPVKAAARMYSPLQAEIAQRLILLKCGFNEKKLREKLRITKEMAELSKMFLNALRQLGLSLDDEMKVEKCFKSCRNQILARCQKDDGMPNHCYEEAVYAMFVLFFHGVCDFLGAAVPVGIKAMTAVYAGGKRLTSEYINFFRGNERKQKILYDRDLVKKMISEMQIMGEITDATVKKKWSVDWDDARKSVGENARIVAPRPTSRRKKNIVVENTLTYREWYDQHSIDSRPYAILVSELDTLLTRVNIVDYDHGCVVQELWRIVGRPLYSYFVYDRIRSLSDIGIARKRTNLRYEPREGTSIRIDNKFWSKGGLNILYKSRQILYVNYADINKATKILRDTNAVDVLVAAVENAISLQIDSDALIYTSCLGDLRVSEAILRLSGAFEELVGFSPARHPGPHFYIYCKNRVLRPTTAEISVDVFVRNMLRGQKIICEGHIDSKNTSFMNSVVYLSQCRASKGNNQKMIIEGAVITVEEELLNRKDEASQSSGKGNQKKNEKKAKPEDEKKAKDAKEEKNMKDKNRSATPKSSNKEEKNMNGKAEGKKDKPSKEESEKKEESSANKEDREEHDRAKTKQNKWEGPKVPYVPPGVTIEDVSDESARNSPYVDPFESRRRHTPIMNISLHEMQERRMKAYREQQAEYAPDYKATSPEPQKGKTGNDDKQANVGNRVFLVADGASFVRRPKDDYSVPASSISDATTATSITGWSERVRELNAQFVYTFSDHQREVSDIISTWDMTGPWKVYGSLEGNDFHCIGRDQTVFFDVKGMISVDEDCQDHVNAAEKTVNELAADVKEAVSLSSGESAIIYTRALMTRVGRSEYRKLCAYFESVVVWIPRTCSPGQYYVVCKNRVDSGNKSHTDMRNKLRLISTAERNLHDADDEKRNQGNKCANETIDGKQESKADCDGPKARNLKQTAIPNKHDHVGEQPEHGHVGEVGQEAKDLKQNEIPVKHGHVGEQSQHDHDEKNMPRMFFEVIGRSSSSTPEIIELSDDEFEHQYPAKENKIIRSEKYEKQGRDYQRTRSLDPDNLTQVIRSKMVDNAGWKVVGQVSRSAGSSPVARRRGSPFLNRSPFSPRISLESIDENLIAKPAERRNLESTINNINDLSPDKANDAKTPDGDKVTTWLEQSTEQSHVDDLTRQVKLVEQKLQKKGYLIKTCSKPYYRPGKPRSYVLGVHLQSEGNPKLNGMCYEGSTAEVLNFLQVLKPTVIHAMIEDLHELTKSDENITKRHQFVGYDGTDDPGKAISDDDHPETIKRWLKIDSRISGRLKGIRYESGNDPATFARNSIKEIRALWSAQLAELLDVCGALVDFVKRNPRDVKKIKSMLIHYASQKPVIFIGRSAGLYSHTDVKLDHEYIYYDGSFVKAKWVNGRPNNESIEGVIVAIEGGRIFQEYNLLEATSAIKYGNLQQLPSVELIQGVPGCGKTYEICNSQEENDLIVTTTRENTLDIRSRLTAKGCANVKERVRTTHSFLMHGIRNKKITGYDTVWADEALMSHCGELMLIVIKSGCRRLVLLGDKRQIPYVNRVGVMGSSYARILQVCNSEEYRNLSRRVPRDIAGYFSNLFSFEFATTNQVGRSVRCVKVNSFMDLGDHDVYLTFTQSDKELLRRHYKNKPVHTVHEYQGKEANSIGVYRNLNKPGLVLFDDPNQCYVALTRHRRELVYYTRYHQSDGLSKYIAAIIKNSDNQPDLIGGGEAWMGLQRRDISDGKYTDFIESSGLMDFPAPRVVEEEKFAFNSVLPKLGAKFRRDAVVDTAVLQTFHDAMLPGNSVVFDDCHVDQVHFGDLDIDITAANVRFDNNVYKHSKFDKLEPVLRTSAPHPRPRSVEELLLAYSKRNDGVPVLTGALDAEATADLAIKIFMKECIDPSKQHLLSEFGSNKIGTSSSAIEEWLKTQKGKKIDFKREGVLLERLDQFNLMHKGKPKPAVDLSFQSTYASLQTICYHESEVNAYFSPMVKEFRNRVMAVLKDNLMIYTDMSPVEFGEQLEKRFGRRLEQCYSMENDISKYDKSQGRLHLLIECGLMIRFGFPADIVNLWYQIHESGEVQARSEGFRARTSFQRKSGDAMTFFGNTLMLIVSTACLFDLSKAVGAVFAGDDSVVYIAPDDYRDISEQFANVFNFESKLGLYKSSFFCSKFILNIDGEVHFVPDPVKVVVKLGRKDLVNWEHCEDYRISLLDLLGCYNNIDIADPLSDALEERYGYYFDILPVLRSIVNVVRNRSSFEQLFVEKTGARLCLDKNRPNLDM